MEVLLQTTCVELGLAAAIAGCLITGDAVKELAVPNTLSQSWYLGRAVHLAMREQTDLIKAIACVMTLVAHCLTNLTNSKYSSIQLLADFFTAAK